MKVLYQLVFVLLFLNCVDQNNRIIHPTKENTPDISENYVKYINSKISEINVESLVASIQDLKIETGINKSNEDYTNLFGFIIDVVIDSKNRIYILDERRQDVSIFSENGEFINTIGGKGAGPGETESAKSLSIYNDEWLLINNFNRVEVYLLKEDEIIFYKTVNFDKPVSNLCVINNTLYTYSPIAIANYTDSDKHSFPLIHAYSMPDLNHMFSFGESYKSESLPIISQLSFGELSCNESSSTVIFKFNRFPYMYGYSASDGSLKWVNIFDELQIPIVEETRKGGQIGLGFNSKENKYNDTVLRTKAIQDNYQLVQIDRRLIPKKNDFISESEVLSFIIDTSDGRSTYIGNNFPRILGVSEELLVGVHSDYVEALILK
jgi:hypothetical protein